MKEENIVRKMLKIDLKDENNLHFIETVKREPGAIIACKKAKTMEALEVTNFKRNAKDFLIKLGKS